MPDPPRPPPPRSALAAARAWIHWFGPARLVVTAVSVAAVLAGSLLLLRPSGPPVEASLPLAERATGPVTSTPPPGGAPATSAVVVVHVAGAVARPGVVQLPAGQRVVDALDIAGGPAPDADLDALNLAAPLVDGSRIYVPRVGEAIPAPIDAAAPVVTGPVDLNTADAAQLDLLPGIGPATAAAIVAHRRDHGPFGSVDQLADVPGIGPSKLDALRGLVTV